MLLEFKGRLDLLDLKVPLGRLDLLDLKVPLDLPDLPDLKALLGLLAGPTGPQGATGATGPTGPQGATGEAAPILDSYAMVHDETNTTVAPQNPILFQTTNLSNKINYNPNTGEFVIPEDGIYLIHWWINVRHGDNITQCEPKALGVELHQFWPSDNLIAHSSTHNKMTSCDTGTINGNAIFSANAGSSYRFINTSEVDIKLVPNDLYSACVSISRIV